MHGVRHAQGPPAEIEAPGIDVEGDDLRTRLRGKLHDREADRPRADDECEFAGDEPGPLDRVAANGERLDARELIQLKFRRWVQLASRHGDRLPHPAVGVDAEHAELAAAVRLSAPA